MGSPPTTFILDEIHTPSRISTPLAIFLEKLDAIPSSTIPSGFIRNTKLLNSLYAKKQQQIDAIVLDFASLYTIPINFIALFEQRMIACGNTLTKQQTEHYSNVLDFYLQFKITNNQNRVAAKSLLTYLETHAADPDNSLIGLTPSKSILENLQDTHEEEKKVETGPAPPKPDFASMFTTQDLIEMILRWDEMSDDDSAICIHQFAASVRNHGNHPHHSHPLSSSSSGSSSGNSSSSSLSSFYSSNPSTSNVMSTSSSSLSSSSGNVVPPSSPLPMSVSVHSIPKNASSPALFRSSSYGSFNNLATASPPGSPASPHRHATAANANTSFSLFPSLFKKTLDFKLPVEKMPWKEGDVVVVFVGMVLDPNNKDELVTAIKTAREEMNEDAFMFARVSDPCIDADQNVGVFIDKNETKVRVVSKESVFMIKFTQTSPSMVADVSQIFFAKLSSKLAERTNLFLVSQGLDLEVLERALVNKATFFDIPVLKKNIACVHSLQLLDNITWSNFLTSVRTYSESKVKSFVVEIQAEGKTFALARKQILNQLNEFDYASIPSARLQSYLSNSQAAIVQLKKKEEDILEGTTKQVLSEWYLEHIKDCVDEFLTRSGVALDVIPENYIDEAPKDMAEVNKTWAHVRHLLDVLKDYNCMDSSKHEVIDVMTTLMDEIYARLHEFVQDSLFVISDKLGIPKSVFEVSDNQDVYDELYTLFVEKKADLEGDLREKLDELLKDVEYIFKIREMEGFQQNGKSRDHVPISGLIASRFFRLENELRTSMDVWDPERLESVQNCAEQEKIEPSNTNSPIMTMNKEVAAV